MKTTTKLYTLGDVVRLLEVEPYRITYLLYSGQVAEPELRIGGRRVFTLADIERLAEKLNIALAHELQAGSPQKHL